MWQIDKTFDFCYSHRVYVQRLNHDFCSENDTACACRHIHGHQGKVHIFLEAEQLDDRAMVVDFKEIGFMKDFIDKKLDHKFIIDINDPMYSHLVLGTWGQFVEKSNRLADADKSNDQSVLNYIQFLDVKIPGTDLVAGRIIDLSLFEDMAGTSEYEVLEGFFIIDFIPTSENLSRWLHGLAQSKLDLLGVKVQRVEFWETPKSRSTYVAP